MAPPADDATRTAPDAASAEPTPRKRLKWEPGALMALVLFLGLWLALGPASGPSFATRADSTTLELRLGQTRGLLETTQGPAGTEPRFRLFAAGRAAPSRELSAAEVRELFGERVYTEAVAARRNRLFRLLNITSWANLVWIGVGLGGQLAFTGRMLLQWIVSEKRRQSVISESFWWFSLIGAVALFAYFVWRQDPVAILGQSSGIVIYARNLRLIYKQKRRAAQA